jgi:hypothetical protein
MESTVLARAIALIEECKESLEAPRRRDLDLTRIHSRLTEVEGLLLGEPPCRPEDN